MSPLKILLKLLKALGEEKVRAELAKAFRRMKPARWVELETETGNLHTATAAKDSDAMAQEVLNILVGIKP